MKTTTFLRIGVSLLLLILFWAAVGQAQNQRFGGVGLQVVPTVDGDLVVLNVLKTSPAQTAGLRPGDLIVQVDDFPLKGSVFKEVVSRYLWGEVGTKVTLKYLRPGMVGSHSVTLKRVSLTSKPTRTPGVRLLEPKNK